MCNLNWKYKIDLKDPVIFQKIEKEYGVVIPDEFKMLIVNANAATPSKIHFMLGVDEKIVGSILSYNESDVDVDTVFAAMKVINCKEHLPFAIDPFGNYWCYSFSEHSVLFWDHETDEVSLVGLSIEKFLDLLY